MSPLGCFRELEKAHWAQVKELNAANRHGNWSSSQRELQKGTSGNHGEVGTFFVEVAHCGERLREGLDLVHEQEPRPWPAV